MSRARTHLDGDWFSGGLPGNLVLGKKVYIDTSYGFHAALSQRDVGIRFGDYCGSYDRSTYVIGPRGSVRLGSYTFLNATYFYCNDRITVGSFVMFAWGVIVTDTWLPLRSTAEDRRRVLAEAAADPERRLPPSAPPRPVTIEDNVWVGFSSVVLPGVTLGRGCIIGCKTIVRDDVPPYAIVVGDPPRIVRTLEPDDDEGARERAIQEYAHHL